MAVYKPSNLSPNLAEIDVTQGNTFSCQVNSSGESIRAYQLEILAENGYDKVYESQGTTLPTPVRNKGILNINNLSNQVAPDLENGKDYQWKIRTYNVPIGSTAQPNTLVCTGFLVGSTRYVIWTQNNDKLEYDRYIQITTTGRSQIMDILEPNEDNIVLPEEGETFTERRLIDWVEKDLGWNKDITKIELTENFTYNYINGTKFDVYLCSDEHTYSKCYADPNDAIDAGDYIIIYENQEDATQAHNAGDTPAKTTVTPRETGRKITGYTQLTGEIRVQQPFEQVPVNGNAYLAFEYNRVEDTYTEITSDVSQLIGGTAITDDSFTIMTNLWTTDTKQLFIQPNINIKPDDTNPNEIVFDDSGTRVDIIKTESTTVVPGKTTDITFEKLDNTQWLLRYMSSVNGVTPPIIPGSTYTVYTDFMDSMPYSIFYARKEPVITMQYKNLNTTEAFQNISSTQSVPYRDIQFYTVWESENNTQVKYYQYILYDNLGEEVSRSEEIYDAELTWYFRGFQTSDYENAPQKYTIQIRIIDEYDKEFNVTSDFLIYYVTEEGIVPMQVDFDCDEMAMHVLATSPVYVETTDRDDKVTVDVHDIDASGYLKIPEGEILNYTNVINEERTPIIISPTFSYLTQFQITGDFTDYIPVGGELEVLEIAHKIDDNTFDVFTLKMSSLLPFYITEDGIIQQNSNQFNLKIYKNDSTTPLMCFNNGTADYFNIKTEDTFNEFLAPQYMRYALQEDTGYSVVEALPIAGVAGTKYLLVNDYVMNSQMYLQGIWEYQNGKWVSDYSAEFMFVETLSQVPGYDYDSLLTPQNCRDDNNNLLWEDTGNLWVDTNNYRDRVNKAALNKKWFMLYLTVDNTGDSEVVRCQIQINNERR